MLPPLPSKFKLSLKLTITRWLSSLNRVNSSFQLNIFLALTTVFLLIRLNLPTLVVKLRNGLKLIMELELPLMFQSRTRSSSLMERNTLTKHLSLLQVSTIVIIMLKVFQKWELDQKRTMSSSICWITRKPLVEITITDGTMVVEIWSAILQLLHTRVKVTISGLFTTSHGWDKINN